MTTREFAAKIIEEHFLGNIDHLKSGWGHNFNAEFKDRRDNTYTAIRLVLEFWEYPKDNIQELILWLRNEELKAPHYIRSALAWNLYYSLAKDQTEREMRKIDKKDEMFSLLRHIELHSFSRLSPEQQERLTKITRYILEI